MVATRLATASDSGARAFSRREAGDQHGGGGGFEEPVGPSRGEPAPEAWSAWLSPVEARNRASHEVLGGPHKTEPAGVCLPRKRASESVCVCVSCSQ